MNFTFENQGMNTYLVYRIADWDSLDTMSLGMLTNNKIPGLAEAFFTQMDTEKFIKYNISAKLSVKQFFSGQVNRKRLAGVFLGIVNAMISAEEYMIDTNTILLDMEYMYVDVSTCNTVLICLPVSMEEPSKALDLGVFLKNIVFSIKFDQTENIDYVGKIINYLNSTPSFSVYDFKKILEEINGKAVSGQDMNPSEYDKGKNKNENNYRPVSSSVQPEMQTWNEERYDVDASRQKETQKKAGGISQSESDIPLQKPVNVLISKPNIDNMQNDRADAVNTASVAEHPPMSMLYLLRHYNKENAEIYKAQQEQKKNRNQEKKNKSQNQSNNGFAIPGQTDSDVEQSNWTQNKQRQGEQSQSIQLQNMELQSTQGTPQFSGEPSFSTHQNSAKNFGETIVLSDSAFVETTVLNEDPVSMEESKSYLLRLKNNEKIVIDKDVFKIGKEKSYVDYFIGDNPAISRSHAYIITRNREHYIVDTNSRNHTYINGVMINSNTENKLEDGARLRLANEEFEYKMV